MGLSVWSRERYYPGPRRAGAIRLVSVKSFLSLAPVVGWLIRWWLVWAGASSVALAPGGIFSAVGRGFPVGVLVDFGDALTALRMGCRVARTGWNGAGMFVELQLPDEYSKMQRPYLFMNPVGGDFVPWVASQTDLLASDWEVVYSPGSEDDDSIPIAGLSGMRVAAFTAWL